MQSQRSVCVVTSLPFWTFQSLKSGETSLLVVISEKSWIQLQALVPPARSLFQSRHRRACEPPTFVLLLTARCCKRDPSTSCQHSLPWTSTRCAFVELYIFLWPNSLWVEQCKSIFTHIPGKHPLMCISGPLFRKYHDENTSSTWGSSLEWSEKLWVIIITYTIALGVGYQFDLCLLYRFLFFLFVYLISRLDCSLKWSASWLFKKFWKNVLYLQGKNYQLHKIFLNIVWG